MDIWKMERSHRLSTFFFFRSLAAFHNLPLACMNNIIMEKGDFNARQINIIAKRTPEFLTPPISFHLSIRPKFKSLLTLLPIAQWTFLQYWSMKYLKFVKLPKRGNILYHKGEQGLGFQILQGMKYRHLLSRPIFNQGCYLNLTAIFPNQSGVI